MKNLEPLPFCFNGKIYTTTSAVKISPFSQTLQYGASVFETFRTFAKGKFWHLEDHLLRLKNSIKVMHLKPPKNYNQKQLKSCLFLLIDAILSDTHAISKPEIQTNWRFKIFVSEEFWWIFPTKLEPENPKIYEEGVEITNSVCERIFPEAKTGNPIYWYHHKIRPKNVFETIFFDRDGFLREGNITNVFAVFSTKNFLEIRTPEKRILRGVMRQEVIKIAQEKHYKISAQEISKPELESAHAIFLTNTIKGIIPVKKWGNLKYNDFSVVKNLRASLPF